MAPAARGAKTDIGKQGSHVLTNRNIFETLRQPNVFAAGGMYMAPKQLVGAADWKAVKAVAEEAVRAAAG